MSQAIDLKKVVEPETFSAEDLKRLIAQSRSTDDDHRRPINIQINVANDDDLRRRGRDVSGFKLARSKIFWLLLAVCISFGATYARTRYVCQSFKDDGRFFYGMGVDRCVSVLMRQPFDQIQSQLEAINRSY